MMVDGTEPFTISERDLRILAEAFEMAVDIVVKDETVPLPKRLALLVGADSWERISKVFVLAQEMGKPNVTVEWPGEDAPDFHADIEQRIRVILAEMGVV